MPVHGLLLETAPAAPLYAVPALAGVLIATLIAWIVFAGLKFGYRWTFGALLNSIAKACYGFGVKILGHRIHPLRRLANPMHVLNRTVLNGLGNAEATAEHAATWALDGLGQVALLIASSAEAEAETLLRGLNDLITRDIPALGADLIDWSNHRYHGIDEVLHKGKDWVFHHGGKVVSHADRRAAARDQVLSHGVDRRIRNKTLPLFKGIDWVKGQTNAIRGGTKANTKAINRAHAQIGQNVGTGRHSLGARVGVIEKDIAKTKPGVATAATATVVAAALGKLGLNWLRCRNVGRVGKAICGMDSRLLDMLLGEAVIAFAAADLCAFSAAVEAIAEQTRPALFALVDVEQALVGCHGAPGATVIALNDVSQTPLYDTIAA